MKSADLYHDAAELFDLGLLHAGHQLAFCCKCRRLVQLGEPDRVGSLFAIAHRLRCGDLGDDSA